MSQTPQHLPALVGGYPSQKDLIPSIICSALYVLLLPLFFYRFCRKTTRTSVLFTILGFIIERSIVFGLRAAIAFVPGTEEGLMDVEGLMEYMQTTFFMGIVAISQDLAMLVRTILVNATYGSEAVKEIPRLKEYLPQSSNPSDAEAVAKTSRMSWKEDALSMNTYHTKSGWSLSGTTVVQDDTEEYPDQPRLRFWFRRMHDGMTIAFLLVFVTGLLGNCRLIVQRNHPARLKENEILRYVGSVLSVMILVFMNALIVWARVFVPRLNKKATYFVHFITALLLISVIYRFTIMSQYTTTYYSLEPSAQNSLRSKIIFYLVDLLPEWLAVFICLTINVRKVFQTGCEGDSRWWDETPKEKEKRLMKEKEKELKKGDGLISTPVISRLSRGRFAMPLVSSI